MTSAFARRLGAGVAASAGVLAGPGAALACSACFWGDDNAFAAYMGTAALMALLPLALIGGIGWWLYRKTRDGGDSWTSGADGRRQ